MTREDDVNPRQRLRRLMRERGAVAPGAYNAMTAMLVEQAGFPAVYMTGSGTSAALGFPDFGLLTMTEMVAAAAAITRSVSIPLIADADTGYGNEMNVTRTVREYEACGVAALHIEDQVSPKRCGHLEGKSIVGREEFLIKIEAAVRARRDPDFVIIARTDARSVVGFDEAIERMNASLKVGADMAFIDTPMTLEEVEQIPRLVQGPCLWNLGPGGKSPLVDCESANAMGYVLTIVPGVLSKATLDACDDALAQLKATNMPPIPRTSIAEGARRMGADAWNAITKRVQR